MTHSIIAGVGEIDEIRMYRAQKIIKLASRISGAQGLEDTIAPELAVDIFYSFYLPLPVLAEDAAEQLETGDPRDALRLSVVTQLLGNINLWRVKPYTVTDSLVSTVAAASFVERLYRALPKDYTRQRSSRQGRSGGRGMESMGTRGSEDKIKEAVEKAMEAAERDSRTAKSIKQMITKVGVGRTSVLEFDESVEEILRLARETDVERILEKVEGIRVAFSKSRAGDRFVKGWVEGVEYGGDLERLHDSQLALPEEYFYYSLANNKLLLYKKVLPASRGPIYVLLDKSGSMVGTKIDWARAVAVALFRKAVEDNRLFYARFFDSVAYPPITLRPRSRAGEVVKLLSYLARVRAGGGTDITRAAAAAVEDILSVRRAREISDIVLITDGEDRLSSDILSRLMKKGNLRLHTVMVQGHNPYLKKASYRYLVVKKLEESDALRVMDFS